MSWRWPVTVSHVLPSGRMLTLRPLARSDRGEWGRLRERSAGWLGRWESTVPGMPPERVSFGRLRRGADRAAHEGLLLPLVIDVDRRIVGQVQLFDVLWGARRCAWAGYWLDEGATGRGYATWALAALIDHALLDVGLHRVEVAIRPENTPSLRVVERLGLPEEGLQRGLMHVEGGWRDHRCFAVLAEDLAPGGYAPDGLVRLLRDRPQP